MAVPSVAPTQRKYDSRSSGGDGVSDPRELRRSRDGGPAHTGQSTRGAPLQAPSVPANLRAWEVFEKWDKPFLCAFSDNDPVTGGAERGFRERVPGAKGQPHTTIRAGGHFLQGGRGEELARIVAEFVKSTS